MTHYVDNFSFPYRQRGAGIAARTTDNLNGLSRLSHFLIGSDTLEDLVERATGYILDLLHIDYCHIFILGENGHYNFRKEDPWLALLVEEVFNQVTNAEEIQRPDSPLQQLVPETKKILGMDASDGHWIIPLKVERAPVGVLVLGKSSTEAKDAFPKDNFYLVDLIADQLGNALHRKQLNERLANSSIETVLALSKTLETRDPYSGAHSKHMAVYSEQIALANHFSVRETRELCWAALLHDIGKIGIEDQVLHKPGPLTMHEWEVMKTHSEIGSQIVRGLTGLERIAEIILAHHERMDGTGYPRQLRGSQIPLGARIIAVVDSYSAMTEGRVYRQPRPHEEAILELKKFSGSMFDPEVVNTFIHLFEQDTLD